MKDRIILFSHNIHAFIFNEIRFASQTYQKVILIAPEDKELQAVCDRYANVTYEPYVPFRGPKELVQSFFQLDHRIIREVCRAVVHRSATIDYL